MPWDDELQRRWDSYNRWQETTRAYGLRPIPSAHKTYPPPKPDSVPYAMFTFAYHSIMAGKNMERLAREDMTAWKARVRPETLNLEFHL